MIDSEQKRTNPLVALLHNFSQQIAKEPSHHKTKSATGSAPERILEASNEEISSRFSPSFSPLSFSELLLDVASRRSQDFESVLTRIFYAKKKACGSRNNYDGFLNSFVNGLVLTLKAIRDKLVKCQISENDMAVENDGQNDLGREKLKFYIGILLDWIVQLCVELDNDLLLQLIFFTPQTEVATYSTSYDIAKPLLSGLLHKASWESRRKCFNYLLDQLAAHDAKKVSLNPSNCLDFLAAFLNHPQSWSGFLSKSNNTTGDNERSQPPSLHTFTVAQINQISDLIAEEMDALQELAKKGNGDTSDHHSAIFDVRLSFLITCIKQDVQQHLHAAASHISKNQIKSNPLGPSTTCESLFLDMMTIDRTLSPLVNGLGFQNLGLPRQKKQKTKLTTPDRMLIGLYMEFPDLVHSINSKYSTEIPFPVNKYSSKIDFVIHETVKRLLDPETHTIAYIICRKLAMTHPSLLIRYLSTLGTLLKGRFDISPSEFLRRKHHMLYIQTLGILDALCPQVFVQVPFCPDSSSSISV